MKLFFYMLGLVLFISSCSKGEQDDKVKEISKEGAIETSFTTQHVNDSLDVLVSLHKVWKNNVLIKTIEKYDTVPSLGMVNMKNEKDVEQNVKKDYEIYITIK
jgi:hypothetical protein